MSPTAGGSQARKRRSNGKTPQARRSPGPTWVPEGQQDAWDEALAAFPAPEPTRGPRGAQRPAQDRTTP